MHVAQCVLNRRHRTVQFWHKIHLIRAVGLKASISQNGLMSPFWKKKTFLSLKPKFGGSLHSSVSFSTSVPRKTRIHFSSCVFWCLVSSTWHDKCIGSVELILYNSKNIRTSKRIVKWHVIGRRQRVCSLYQKGENIGGNHKLNHDLYSGRSLKGPITPSPRKIDYYPWKYTYMRKCSFSKKWPTYRPSMRDLIWI